MHHELFRLPSTWYRRSIDLDGVGVAVCVGGGRPPRLYRAIAPHIPQQLLCETKPLPSKSGFGWCNSSLSLSLSFSLVVVAHVRLLLELIFVFLLLLLVSRQLCWYTILCVDKHRGGSWQIQIILSIDALLGCGFFSCSSVVVLNAAKPEAN